MSQQKEHPLRKIWLARAAAGFLRAGAPCVRSRTGHRVEDNKTRTGLVKFCTKCLAGIALTATQEEAEKDITSAETDLRQACWMCGAAFSQPRTKDEYIRQLCCGCLIAVADAGLVKLMDPRTRDTGHPTSQTHTTR